jgi:hypothetical protein
MPQLSRDDSASVGQQYAGLALFERNACVIDASKRKKCDVAAKMRRADKG